MTQVEIGKLFSEYFDTETDDPYSGEQVVEFAEYVVKRATLARVQESSTSGYNDRIGNGGLWDTIRWIFGRISR